MPDASGIALSTRALSRTAFWTRAPTLPLLAALCAVAVISLSIGAANALRPGQSQDVRSVRGWAEVWLRLGLNPYVAADADYPPNAVAFLSPLALVPEPALAPIWIALNLVLALLAAWLACWVVIRPGPSRVPALLAALFLSWAGLRIGLGVGQFHLLALTLGLLAVALSDTRPGLSGVLLGLALVKPHVAGAFFLWALLTRRLRLAVTAVLVVAVGVLGFCLRLGQSPVDIVRTYLTVLDSEVGLQRLVAGIDLRPGLHLLFGPTLEASVAHAVLVAGLVVALVLAAIRLRGPGGTQADRLLLGLCCAFALLALPHSTYDVVLLLPAIACLASPRVDWVGRRALFVLAQLALIVDLPGLVYRIGNYQQSTSLAVLATTYTGVVAMVFAYLLWTALARQGRARVSPTPVDEVWVASEFAAGRGA